MKKIGLIAGREFLAAVGNRGFVIGLLVMPLLVTAAIFILPRIMNGRSSQVRGEVAVIDRTGVVTPELQAAIAPEAIDQRRHANAERALASMPEAVRLAASSSAAAASGPPPELTIDPRPATADIQTARAWLTEPPEPGRPRHAALVVVHADAITAAEGRAEYGTYDIYVPSTADDRVESALHEAIREAMLTARLRAGGLNRSSVEAMMRVTRPSSITVGAGEDRPTSLGFNRLMPFAFGGLLMIGIIIGGQSLLTSTIEEKSNRVVEVLLSAVSPLELMAGKILGQLLITLLILVLYLGAGIALLASYAMLGLLDPMLVVYLLVFFLVSFLLYASVFGAVGAAVNDIREAQSLMTPVMLVLMTPWMLGTAIAREPSSTFSVALSFIPPVNSFAMMMRLASSAPPPAWQVWLTVLVGFLAACGVIWVAAKVFKVGLLMHGKPPSFATLLQWVKQA